LIESIVPLLPRSESDGRQEFCLLIVFCKFSGAEALIGPELAAIHTYSSDVDAKIFSPEILLYH
jgi:hypothetical protein